MVAPDFHTYDRHWEDTAGDYRHFRCEICHAFFENDNNLQQHSKVHRQADIECPACYNMYTSYSNMVRHMETGCENASAELIRLRIAESMLGEHCLEISHHDIWNGDPQFDDNPYYCGECARRFGNLGSLVAHFEDNASCPVRVEDDLFQDILETLSP
ncbi:hypothetical protein D6D02_09030 [Aureobasidium pullulans]|uniref:C2H2-type domain-containing protein n=1 Tax=Aureobasidium pullulans TaxID=5580 RepID=A0A4S8VNZ0_AURPU|nr:hypothetical protein D6D24_06330 [Aureobasidium pullulans]THX99985.1 hypothetical protein D6D02_09030 [Aureobasidium pullulans]THY02396.1 hypothetical protein D6D03_05111 [Aureobasidium pullulans]